MLLRPRSDRTLSADRGAVVLRRRQKVVVPVVQTAGMPLPGVSAAPSAGAGITSASDLDALPGIGPVLVQRAVDGRTEDGSFDSVDQLREVTGTGESEYEELRTKVVV